MKFKEGICCYVAMPFFCDLIKLNYSHDLATLAYFMGGSRIYKCGDKMSVTLRLSTWRTGSNPKIKGGCEDEG
jgi:hypothetical protein